MWTIQEYMNAKGPQVVMYEFSDAERLAPLTSTGSRVSCIRKRKVEEP